MGFPYLYTFFYHYPWLTDSPPKRVNLKRQTIIVDGNSTMYSIYDKAVNDDRTRMKTEQVTKTPFGYEKYGNLLHEVFSQFRHKCKKVIVVFDGVYRRHRHRRSDPERMSSLRFAALNQHGTQLPSLFEDKFKSVLSELDMDVIVARGEADPMIAALAEDLNAYVVAGDSDYHLYNLKQGYVPLRFLDFEQMEGSLYQTEDIFGVVDSYAVPLWTSLIGYDFVSWDNLQVRLICLHLSCWLFPLKSFQKLFLNFEPHDAQKFHEWLESTDPDKEKRLRITNMFYLLRLIQDKGGESVHDAVIQYVPEEQLEEFNQVRRSYRRITVAQTIRTRGQKELPSYIDKLFVTGKLDRAIINVFINRKLLLFKESNNPVYFKFLLPILQLIVVWNRPDVALENCSSIIFNGQKYNPLESINEDELPSADEMEKMPQKEKKKWLLSCVQSALGSHMIADTDRIREDQLVWICLLKLWCHTTQEQSPTKDVVLRAMIVAYLQRKLLAAAADPPSTYFFHYGEISALSVNWMSRMFFVEDNNSISIVQQVCQTVAKGGAIQRAQRYQQSHDEKCIRQWWRWWNQEGFGRVRAFLPRLPYRQPILWSSSAHARPQWVRDRRSLLLSH